MADPLAFDAAAVTAVIGYTEQIKRFLPDAWQRASVLISCVLGVLYVVALRPSKMDLPRNISAGVMIGLAASGGFAGMKGIVELKANR
jgi:hypothetical protein